MLALEMGSPNVRVAFGYGNREAPDRPAQRSKGGASRCPPPSVIWPRLVCSVRVRETNVEDQDSLPCFGSQAASSREGNGRQGWGWGGVETF